MIFEEGVCLKWWGHALEKMLFKLHHYLETQKGNAGKAGMMRWWWAWKYICCQLQFQFQYYKTLCLWSPQLFIHTSGTHWTHKLVFDNLMKERFHSKAVSCVEVFFAVVFKQEIINSLGVCLLFIIKSWQTWEFQMWK